MNSIWITNPVCAWIAVHYIGIGIVLMLMSVTFFIGFIGYVKYNEKYTDDIAPEENLAGEVLKISIWVSAVSAILVTLYALLCLYCTAKANLSAFSNRGNNDIYTAKVYTVKKYKGQSWYDKNKNSDIKSGWIDPDTNYHGSITVLTDNNHSFNVANKRTYIIKKKSDIKHSNKQYLMQVVVTKPKSDLNNSSKKLAKMYNSKTAIVLTLYQKNKKDMQWKKTE